MAFKRGVSGNPGGRPKNHVHIRELAREATDTAIRTLTDVCENSTNDRARVAAAEALLNRGWGKPGAQEAEARDPWLGEILP